MKKNILIILILLLSLGLRTFEWHKLSQIFYDENGYSGSVPIVLLAKGRFRMAVGKLFTIRGKTVFRNFNRPLWPVFYLIPAFMGTVLEFFDWNLTYQLGAVFTSIFAVFGIYLTYLIGITFLAPQRKGAGYLAALLIGVNIAHIIQSRNVLPYQASLFFYLLSFYVLLAADNADDGRSHKLFFLSGVFASICFMTYVGYYVVYLQYVAYAFYRLFPLDKDKLKNIACLCVGIVAPLIIMQSVLLVLTGFSYFNQLGMQSQKILQGEFSEGWSFYFSYLWSTEKIISLLYWVCILFALVRFIKYFARLTFAWKMVVTTFMLTFINHIVFSVVLHKIVLLARLALVNIPFICLITAGQLMILLDWVEQKLPTGLSKISLHKIVPPAVTFFYAFFHILPIYNSRFPIPEINPYIIEGKTAFLRIHKEETPRETIRKFYQDDKPYKFVIIGLHFMTNVNVPGYSKIYDRIDYPPLFRFPNPITFEPRLFEGFTPHQRRIMLQFSDLEIRVYDYKGLGNYLSQNDT